MFFSVSTCFDPRLQRNNVALYWCVFFLSFILDDTKRQRFYFKMLWMCFEGWIVSLELLTWYFIENCLWGDSTNFVPIILVHKFHVKNVSQNFYIFKCVISSVSRPHRFIRIIVAGIQFWQTIKSHAVCRPCVNDERRAFAVDENRHHAGRQEALQQKGAEQTKTRRHICRQGPLLTKEADRRKGARHNVSPSTEQARAEYQPPRC